MVKPMRRIALLGLGLLAACVVRQPIEDDADNDTDPMRVEAASDAHPTHQLWHATGRSVEGRPIELCRIGRGPKRVLWIGGIHGTEREGSTATDNLPAALIGNSDLYQAVSLTVIRDLNPDGSAAGRRTNALGIDLNRNFPARNFKASRATGERPLDQPEALYLHDLFVRLEPHLVFVCHSTSNGGPYVNYDGPAKALADRFSELSSYRIVESNKLHSTPGSLGSWVGIDQQVPILTLEWQRGTDPEVAWRETREAILGVLDAEF